MFVVWLYLALGVVSSPLIVLVAAIHPRLRRDFRERLGFPGGDVEPGALWFHAASLGERRVVDALLPELRRAHPELPVLVSCTSASARGLTTGPDAVLVAPLDSVPLVLAWLTRVRPRALVLVERELWPALVLGCRLHGIPVVRLAPREGPGMAWVRRIPGLEAALSGGLPTISPLVGLKSLAPPGPPAFGWQGEALVAGCTHQGEENHVLAAWETLNPRPLLVLAPRAPARTDAVLALVAGRGHRAIARSRFSGVVPPGTDVVVLDTLGELGGLYPAARAAFIGGTFLADVGGHSPGEAVAAGCPVVRGPCVAANEAAWATVAAEVAQTPNELAACLARALSLPRSSPKSRHELMHVVDALAPFVSAPVPRERALRPWLWPLGWAWLLAATLRPARPRKVAVPVVAVGGLTAGGAGKTPVTAWIAARLPGSVVVARGYGRRQGRGVRTGVGATELGDELEMLRRRGFSVVSAPDRAAGAAVAVQGGARAVVLDDAFSARDLHRDLDIVVIDARWPEGGGPIPVGTRRVPLSALARADVLWCNHGNPPAWATSRLRPGALVVVARYRLAGWRHRGQVLPVEALPARSAVAIAGIARPSGFFRLLRTHGVTLAHTRIFVDHHRFRWQDLQAIEAWKDEHLVIVTEKDAARLPEGLGVWAPVLELELERGEAEIVARLSLLAGT